jgi:hypothetical protein
LLSAHLRLTASLFLDWMSSSYASTSTFPLSSLQQLVQRLVPELAPRPGSEADPDEDTDRQERLNELVQDCSELLRA